jgi:nitrogen fixation protein FixH
VRTDALCAGRFWKCGGLLLAFLDVLIQAGCAPPPAATVRDASNPRLRLALTTTPDKPMALDPTQFTVRVTDAAGRPVRGATVTVGLAMPTMPMGDNAVALHETHSGVYAGSGRFTMAGAWRVTAAAASGQERAVQSFSTGVR